MSNQLVDKLMALDEPAVLEIVQQRLEAGEDPLHLIEELRLGLSQIGGRFSAGEVFLSELIMSASIFEEMVKLIKPRIVAKAAGATGRVVIGTIAGDVHDLGKNIVITLLEAEGFEVNDLGVDVPAEYFVAAVKEHQPDIVGMSGLLTVAFESMGDTVKALQHGGVRDQVKIMIGGGVVDDTWREKLAADAFGRDANEAVIIAKKWMGVSK